MRDLVLPGWVEPLLGSPLFGFLLLGAGVLLVALAWRSAGNRRVLAVAGAFVAFAFAVNAAVLFGQRKTGKARAEEVRQTLADHVALPADQKLGGWVVPAGSVVSWRGPEHTIADVWMAGPVAGLELVGKWELAEYFWSGRLGADHLIDGWPCAAGEIYLGVNGHLQQCRTSLPRGLEAVAVPAGSQVELSVNNSQDVPLPVTKITFEQPVNVGPGVELPAHSTLTLFATDAPMEAESSQEAIVAYGVTLTTAVAWSYGGVTPARGARAHFVSGNLAEDLQCGARRVKAGEEVKVSRAGAGVQVRVDADASGSPALVGCVAAK